MAFSRRTDVRGRLGDAMAQFFSVKWLIVCVVGAIALSTFLYEADHLHSEVRHARQAGTSPADSRESNSDVEHEADIQGEDPLQTRGTSLAILELLDPFGPNRFQTSLSIPSDELNLFVFGVGLQPSAENLDVCILRFRGFVRDREEWLMFQFIIGTTSEKANDLTVTCGGNIANLPRNRKRWVGTTDSSHWPSVNPLKESMGRSLKYAAGGETDLNDDVSSSLSWQRGPARVDQRYWRHTLDWPEPVPFSTDFLCEVPSSLAENLSKRETNVTLTFGYAGNVSHGPPATMEFTVGPVLGDGPYKLAGCMGPLFGNQSRALWVQWLEYHIHVAGFEKFFLYSVDDTEELIKVLQDYIEEKIVEVRHWESFGTREKFLETRRYYDELTIRSHCIDRNKGVSTWLAFHDTDEFMFVRKGPQMGNITAFLDTLSEEVDEVLIMRYRFPVEHGTPLSELLIETHQNHSAMLDEELGKPIVRTQIAHEVSSHELESFTDGRAKTAENSITLLPGEAIINHYRQTPMEDDTGELDDRYGAHLNQAPFDVVDEKSQNIAMFAKTVKTLVDKRAA